MSAEQNADYTPVYPGFEFVRLGWPKLGEWYTDGSTFEPASHDWIEGDEHRVHVYRLSTHAAIVAVQRLHSPRVFNGDGYGWTVCAECRQAWPCATAMAIDAAFGVERYPNGNVKSGPKEWPFDPAHIDGSGAGS